jgi:hypothetical protein
MPETIKGFGILTPLQKEFIEILASLPDKDQFYLAGGTALAEYYLGHLKLLPPPSSAELACHASAEDGAESFLENS